jgi:hypothetical protein
MTDIGATIRQDRERRGMSRRKYVEMLGAPWTEGKLNGVEVGRREIKPNELEVIARLIPSLNDGSISATPAAPPTVTSAPMPGSGSPSPDQQAMTSYIEQRANAIAAYNRVMQRLAGKPAPPFGLPSQYRVDACPPEDLPRWHQWCDRVNEWLDQAETGTGIFAAGGTVNDAAVIAINEDEEQHFLDPVPTIDLTEPNRFVTTGDPVIVEQVIPDAPHSTENRGFAVTQVTQPVDLTQLRTPELELAPQPAAEPTPDIQPIGKQALWLQDGTRRISNSELQTFKHCRRRWWLSWYRGLRLRLENFTGYAELGTRVHEALAGYYVPDGEVAVDPRETLEKILSRDEAKLLEATRDQDGTNVASQLTEFKKDADLARAMVDGYVEWIAEGGMDQGYHVIAPEQVLSAAIEAASNHRFTLVGKLDVRLLREHDQVHLFMDHKTVGDFKTPVRTLPLDEQMRTYHLLEVENNGEQRTEGALYNMLRRVKRTAQANPPFYERLEVRHNPHVIDNFRERLKGEALMINFVENALDEGVSHQTVAFPSPSRDCTWKCEFTAICSMLDDNSRAEDFLSEHYVTINPMDRYDRDLVKGQIT